MQIRAELEPDQRLFRALALFAHRGVEATALVEADRHLGAAVVDHVDVPLARAAQRQQFAFHTPPAGLRDFATVHRHQPEAARGRRWS